MTITLLTFGGGSQPYYDAVRRLIKQAESFPFDNIIAYSDVDLKEKFPAFWQQHEKFILTRRRGFGYWIWKPFIILETLKTLKEGDILVYLDCGCELNSQGIERFNDYIELVKKNENMLFHLEDKHTELRWNKMDLLIHLNMKDNKDLHMPQSESGMQFYLCNDSNKKLLQECYEICCNYNLIDDSPSKVPNLPYFIEHRHDQSVLSLLFKKYNYYTIFDETWPETMNGDKSKYPIWALRTYGFESRIKF